MNTANSYIGFNDQLNIQRMISAGEISEAEYSILSDVLFSSNEPNTTDVFNSGIKDFFEKARIDKCGKDLPGVTLPSHAKCYIAPTPSETLSFIAMINQNVLRERLIASFKNDPNAVKFHEILLPEEVRKRLQLSIARPVLSKHLMLSAADHFYAHIQTTFLLIPGTIQFSKNSMLLAYSGDINTISNVTKLISSYPVSACFTDFILFSRLVEG